MIPILLFDASPLSNIKWPLFIERPRSERFLARQPLAPLKSFWLKCTNICITRTIGL
jgi:hypothetical protein